MEVPSNETPRSIWTLPLLQLPNEILEHLFLLLHPLEVVKCRQASSRYITRVHELLNPHISLKLNRHFKELIDGSIELQLRVDLAIDGYLLGHRGTDPAKNVREFQERRRKALESMKPITSWEEPITPADFGPYEVSSTYFGSSLCHPC
jgi:hypothetical protein